MLRRHRAVVPKPSYAAAAAGCGIGAADWPRGCLGYAVNLVRPAQPGHRASVLHSCLSGLLVFEGLAEAEQYRELLATVRARRSLASACRAGLRHGMCMGQVHAPRACWLPHTACWRARPSQPLLPCAPTHGRCPSPPAPTPAQRLRTGCCTIVTLDGGRIQANGVVCGSSYSVPPLEAADHRFGSSGLLGEVRVLPGAWVGG